MKCGAVKQGRLGGFLIGVQQFLERVAECRIGRTVGIEELFAPSGVKLARGVKQLFEPLEIRRFVFHWATRRDRTASLLGPHPASSGRSVECGTTGLQRRHEAKVVS